MTETTQQERFLTTEQAAELMQCSRITLEVWRGQGRGPRFLKINGHLVRYRMSDVLGWMNQHEHASTSEYPSPQPGAPRRGRPQKTSTSAPAPTATAAAKPKAAKKATRRVTR